MLLRALRAACLSAVLVGCDSPVPSPYPPTSVPTPSAPAATPAGTPDVSSPPATASAPPLPLSESGRWAELAASGVVPAPREDHTWTVNTLATTAYLFGGRDGGRVYDDLWAYDLKDGTWREIEVSGPRPEGRFGHEAAFTGGLLVALGQAGSAFFGDVWVFDTGSETWRELPAAGAAPVPRYGSCSGIGPDGNFLVSHGFTEDGARFADTRRYNLGAEAWVDVTPADGVPVARCLHACWWTVDNTFTLFGGQTTGVAALGDLWSLLPGATGRWTRLRTPDAGPRQLAAVAQRGYAAYVFGGRDIDRRPLADTWVVDDRNAGAFQPLPITGEAPPARSGATLIYDEPRERMLLFGGLGDEALDDLWALTFD